MSSIPSVSCCSSSAPRKVAAANRCHGFISKNRSSPSVRRSSRYQSLERRGKKGILALHPDAQANDVPFDEPTPGFSPIPDALEDIKKGKFVVVLDDEGRENEGDLIGAADLMTQESMAFMIRHTSGLVLSLIHI